VLLANWWPTDDAFMYERILHKTSQVTDCRAALSSDYKQTEQIGTTFARFT